LPRSWWQLVQRLQLAEDRLAVRLEMVGFRVELRREDLSPHHASSPEQSVEKGDRHLGGAFFDEHDS